MVSLLAQSGSGCSVTTAVGSVMETSFMAPQLHFSAIYTTISVPDNFIECSARALTVRWITTQMVRTTRQLLYHSFRIPSLMLRLCVLPLLFVASKITPNLDLNNIPSSGRNSDNCGRMEPVTRDQIRNYVTGFFKVILVPFQIAFTLHQLVQFADRHPDMLSCHHVTHAPTKSRYELDDGRSGSALAIEHSTVRGARLTASQLNRVANLSVPIYPDEDDLESLTNLSSKHEAQSRLGNPRDSPETLQRNSSIQTTPERMRTSPAEMASDFPDIALHGEQLTKLSTIHHQPEANQLGVEVNQQQALMQESSGEETAELKQESVKICPSSCEHLIDGDVKGCPMFEHRHAQSRLPKRVDSHVTKTPTFTNGLATFLTASKKDSVSKRNRLQRRVKR